MQNSHYLHSVNYQFPAIKYTNFRNFVAQLTVPDAHGQNFDNRQYFDITPNEIHQQQDFELSRMSLILPDNCLGVHIWDRQPSHRSF
jgi:hypothetical protein